MTLNPFSSRIENLCGQAQGIEYTSSALMALVRGREFSIPQVEGSHIQIMQVYNRAMNDISLLKGALNREIEIEQKKDRPNDDELVRVVGVVTEIESAIDQIRIDLNDTILTYCPIAKIEYGPSCIGPKKAPFFDAYDRLSKCACIREIRGDGNCFVSSFITRFLETRLEQNTLDAFISSVYEDRSIQEDLKEEIVLTLAVLNSDPSQIETVLADNNKILPLVKYFRLLAADEMLKNQEKFEPGFRFGGQDTFDGVQEGKSYQELISEHVLTMGVDFSHPPIRALCQRLNFNVIVIDTKLGGDEGLEILEDLALPVQGTFCRKSDHYFVLYTQGEAAPMLPQPTAPVPRGEDSSLPTELIINCKVPFGHVLFIRTERDNWQRGVPLTPVDEEHWIYCSSTPLNNIAYKFIVNDDNSLWENGENRKITQGKVDQRSPQFTLPPSFEIQDAPVAPVQTTRITVKYDAGLGNSLFIRGEPPVLSWKKGIALKNISGDTWVFETQENFPILKYKIVLNDSRFEEGQDHKTDCGNQDTVISPKF